MRVEAVVAVGRFFEVKLLTPGHGPSPLRSLSRGVIAQLLNCEHDIATRGLTARKTCINVQGVRVEG